ncbi:unnamed protein product, partial [Arabidopsis halleri]
LPLLYLFTLFLWLYTPRTIGFYRFLSFFVILALIPKFFFFLNSMNSSSSIFVARPDPLNHSF